MRPARRAHVRQHFLAVGQVHEGVARLVGKVAVAELVQPRILRATRPKLGLLAPLFHVRRIVAIVGGENERRARPADAVQFAQRRAPVLAPGNLHQPVEQEKRAAESVIQ